jgi:hypothetical protein
MALPCPTIGHTRRFAIDGSDHARNHCLPLAVAIWPIGASSPQPFPDHIPVNYPHHPEVKIICVWSISLKRYGSETRYGFFTVLMNHIEFLQFFQPLLSALIVLSFVTDFFFFRKKTEKPYRNSKGTVGE